MIEISEIKKDLAKMLEKGKHDRYDHLLRTVKKAEELSIIHNVDTDKCKLAALVHDCAKGNEKYYENSYKDEFLKLINKQELKEFAKGPLEHCVLGYIVAKEKYKIMDMDVLNAVLYHTTGRENMTDIEKVVFLADKTELKRDYPGVDEIRKQGNINLNNAIILCINNTVEFLISKNKKISINSILTRNSLIGGSSGK